MTLRAITGSYSKDKTYYRGAICTQKEQKKPLHNVSKKPSICNDLPFY